MKIWLDAQLSPDLAAWIEDNFDVECTAVRDLELRDASDNEIYERAVTAEAVVMTKDSDFVNLLKQKDEVPGIIWITVENTSTGSMKEILEENFALICRWLEEGESLVEISSDEAFSSDL